MPLQRCDTCPAKVGDTVTLMEQPDGCSSQHARVTVGRSYKVLDLMGSCLVTSTDVPGDSTSLWRGRFAPALQ